MVIWSTMGDDNDGPDPRTAPPAASFLFVRTADSGSLTPIRGRARTYRLALAQLGSPVTVFSDRPQRIATTESTRDFVRRWRSRGSDAVPPNAALELAHGRGRDDVKVFEISDPQLRNGGLTFVARDLGRRSTSALAGFRERADAGIPRRFTRASLFVDSSGSSGSGSERWPSLQGSTADVDVELSNCTTGPGAVPTHRASGDVKGTYPGTFEEQGTWTLGDGRGRLETKFKIRSEFDDGRTRVTIEGTRTFVARRFACTPGRSGPRGSDGPDAILSPAPLEGRYTATISVTPASGAPKTFEDRRNHRGGHQLRLRRGLHVLDVLIQAARADRLRAQGAREVLPARRRAGRLGFGAHERPRA